MQGLINFLDDLLGGFELIALSLSVGGVAWGLFVLRAWQPLSAPEKTIAARCVTLIFYGAAALAALQLIHLAVKALILVAVLDQSPFPAFFNTLQFEAGLSRAAVAGTLAAASAWLRFAPDARRRWAGVAGLAILLVASGAWLTHAVGRFEDRAQLMAWTTMHQMGAAVWVGGIAQLGALWQLTRRREEFHALWPVMLGRFSALGAAAVLLLVVTGSTLAWNYVVTLQGLVGTAYGSLVILKVSLLAAALGLAALNFRAVRRWRASTAVPEASRQKKRRPIWARRWQASAAAPEVRTKVPYFIEAEAMLLVVILLVAATLSSQPPALDVQDQSATWSEVVEAFSPKWPRLTSPDHEEILAGRQARLALADPGRAEDHWSDFNHNVAGLFLLVISVLALAARSRRFPWARHWPIGFALLAAFLFFRSDPETWPLGPVGFWESTLGSGEVLQHRMALVLALGIGLLEWRSRTQAAVATRLPYFFPILCVVGGAVLLTHSHEVFELKREYLIEVSHTVMGVLGVFLGCGRWLELRLAPAAGHMPAVGRWGGVLAISAIMLMGVILTFYHEPPSGLATANPQASSQIMARTVGR